jgi:hypothetical protein
MLIYCIGCLFAFIVVSIFNDLLEKNGRPYTDKLGWFLIFLGWVNVIVLFMIIYEILYMIKLDKIFENIGKPSIKGIFKNKFKENEKNSNC